jgi:hypothetical protein
MRQLKLTVCLKSMLSLGSERIEPEHFGIVSVSAVRLTLDRVRMIEWFLGDDVRIDMQFRDRPTFSRQKVHQPKGYLGSAGDGRGLE